MLIYVVLTALAAIALAVILFCATPAHSATPAQLDRWVATHDLRVRKAEVIVRAFYDHRGRENFLPHCEYLVSEHERLETEGLRKGYTHARGYGAAWWYSLVYGGANFSLRCYATAPGNCAGPLDVKHWPLVLQPDRNIRWHVEEMWGFYKRGVRGRDLCEHTFLPASPRDWGNGRFAKTDAKHRRRIRRAYERGELP